MGRRRAETRTAADRVNGNPSGRPTGGKLRPALLVKPPPAPPELGVHGADLWVRLAAHLVKLQVLSVLDLEALRVLCDQWQLYCSLAEYDDPVKMFVTSDRGNWSEHPAVKRRAEAAKACERIWRLFGLTPLDRESLEIDLASGDNDEIGTFAASRA